MSLASRLLDEWPNSFPTGRRGGPGCAAGRGEGNAPGHATPMKPTWFVEVDPSSSQTPGRGATPVASPGSDRMEARGVAAIRHPGAASCAAAPGHHLNFPTSFPEDQ